MDIEKKALVVAMKASQEAGKLLLKKFGHLHFREKSFKDAHAIVSRADYEAEEIILEFLRKNFPEDGILTEEAGHLKGSSGRVWVIDPLDGTTNYTIGNPLFAVSIALCEEKEPLLAVVYAPRLQEFYWAEKGKGAWLNNRKMKVSSTEKIKEAINIYCHGTRISDMKKAVAIYSRLKFLGRDARQLGSAAIECAFVAAGRTESIVIPGAHPWDVAAGALLVREAGGKVTDFQDKEWNLDSKDILASNGKIHNELLKIIKEGL